MPRDTSVVLSGATLQTQFAEAYRGLRANINFSAIGQGVRAVLVTSGASGEGKSTTVANLAILLAQAGHRVIMVDADFRRPRLRQLFSTNGHRHRAEGVEAFWERTETQPLPLGLLSLIVGTATFVEAATLVEGFDNLWLVPTGVIPPNPSELLSSPHMRAVVADLCDRADVVLLDSPPCSLYADAVELTQVTDGVLYVLKSGPQGLVNHTRALKQLQQGKARLLGIVMNQVDATATGYHGPYRGGGPTRG
jgi:Mrp family chromosome partitioning ATPase